MTRHRQEKNSLKKKELLLFQRSAVFLAVFLSRTLYVSVECLPLLHTPIPEDGVHDDGPILLPHEGVCVPDLDVQGRILLAVNANARQLLNDPVQVETASVGTAYIFLRSNRYR